MGFFLFPYLIVWPHRYLSFLVMACIIVPAVIAIGMVLETMARAEKYTEVYMRTDTGDYEMREGMNLQGMDETGEVRLRVKRKKFEIVEVCICMTP